uniref:DNA-directed RNA polymerase subunit beta n=1 Tax=Lygus hesperus TaxID=30085 RepID=A0A0A9W501_LYGHE
MSASVHSAPLPIEKFSFSRFTPLIDVRSPSYRRARKYKNSLYEHEATAIAREKRRKEIEELENKIIRSRRKEQIFRLPPRQMQLLDELPIISSSSSSSFLSPARTKSRNASISSSRTSQRSNAISIATWGTSGIYKFWSGSDSISSASSSVGTPEVKKSVRIQRTRPESISLEKDQIGTWGKYSTVHQAKQYRALMKEVCKKKHYTKDVHDPFRKGWFGPNSKMDLLDESFQRLREEIGSSIPWPEEAFFETNFSVSQDPSWMVVDIKELVTLPNNLAQQEDAYEMAESAAVIRMAAWDHYFFKHQKAGAKNMVANLFCDLAEGETPVDKFLHPSRVVADFMKLECLWKPLSEKLVLQEYFIWILSNTPLEQAISTKTVPEYLVKNGFIQNLIQQNLPILAHQSRNRQSAFVRKSITNIIERVCPEFAKRISHYS